MSGNNRNHWLRGLPILGLIWLAGAVIDRLWFAIDQSIPSWDQAEYLTGSLNYWNALQKPQWFSADWWASLWLLSSKIPPLTYISTTPFLNLLGRGEDQATLVNLLWSAVLLISVYGLSSCLFTVEIGIWAAALCLLFPGFYTARLDFLLDYPLTAMVALAFWCLTGWRSSIINPPGRWQDEAERNGDAKQKPINQEDLKKDVNQKDVKNPVRWLPFGNRKSFLRWLQSWLWIAAFGLCLGLALMVKQPALLFLLTPLVWMGISLIRKGAWLRLLQLMAGLFLSTWVFGPWYRTNWLIVLTAGKRATVDSAIAEGDPSLTSLAAWTFYVQDLPYTVSWLLLIVPIVGFLLYWKRSPLCLHPASESDQGMSVKKRTHDPLTRQFIRQSLTWLLGFCVGGYLLSSLNINKDPRYVMPYLPVVAILLACGLVLFPRRCRVLRWGTVGLSTIWMVANLFAIAGWSGQVPFSNVRTQHYAYTGPKLPHEQVIAEIIKVDPLLRSTLGVLPSTSTVNQHNLNYYGALRDFQVYGRQVGTQLKQISQDVRAVPWFLAKTGNQGSIRKQDTQTALINAVTQNPDFYLQKSWKLPDGSALQLYHQRTPAIQVEQIESCHVPGTTCKQVNGSFPSPVHLDRITVPDQVPPGVAVPITYEWSGGWEPLRTGLVLLTWRLTSCQPAVGCPSGEAGPPVPPSVRGETPAIATKSQAVSGSSPKDLAGSPKNLVGKGGLTKDVSAKELPIVSMPQRFESRWFHDHGIGMGTLYSEQLVSPAARFRVTERLAMLPPSGLVAGTYRLEARYLDRHTGASYEIAPPPIMLTINPAAPAPDPAATPEPDWVTQLRTLALQLPKGLPALDQIFAQIGRINQYDPIQDYLVQARQALDYRLQQEPDNVGLAYGLALAEALKRRVQPVIATLERVTQLDSKNPNSYAYLAFVHLYDLHPKAAELALKPAIALNPTSPELKALRGISALMQGNLVQAWQDAQVLLSKRK